jgi:DNA topoisomerase-2
MALMRKRVCDVAGSIGKNTKVYLNGEKLPIKGFQDYVNLYLVGKDASQRCYEKVNDRWEVAIALSEGQFQQARAAASPPCPSAARQLFSNAACSRAPRLCR